MKTILYILQKEFLQIFRNKTMLPIIFVVPIIQLIVLVHAATYEMKNINLAIVDLDQSVLSQNLTAKFAANPFFTIKDVDFSYKKAEEVLVKGQVHAIVHIQKGFAKGLENQKNSNVQLSIDAVNGSSAGMVQGYVNSVIADYEQEIRSELFPAKLAAGNFKTIKVDYSFWYNPELDYKTYMVPGILVLLVTIISLFLSAMNIVREKEIGTIEQINVTPIKKYQFLVGKLLPFWLIALFELAFGLAIGKLLFNIPMVGSIPLVFGIAAIYLLATLGIGLFISTISSTQQQAMFVAYFFLIIFILMSGLFTAVESMPEWAQMLNKINPIAYFMRIIRMILLKGSSFANIQKEVGFLALYALATLCLAVFRYRKTT